jgi:hypothetical protein
VSDESIKFLTHREPIWRDRANFIVNAVVEDDEEQSPFKMEQLWTRKLGDDEFEICCIPFFLYDLSLGDVVKTCPRLGRRYVVCETVTKSGRYVFRAWFGESGNAPHGRVAADLEELGALLEWSSPNLLAIDAENLQEAETISGYLAGKESAGELIYETGKSAGE